MNYKKDALLNTIGNFSYLGALWFMSVLVVRLSDFENAGLFALAMTSANIYISLASYTLRMYYAADITEKYSDNQYIATRCITVVVSFLLCIVVSGVLGYNSKQYLAIVLFYIYKSAEMCSDILFGVLQRHGRLYLSGYSLIIKSLSSLCVFAVVLFVTKNLNITFLIMAVLAVCILFFVDIPMARRTSADILCITKKDLQPAVQMLKVCFPLFIVGLCFNLVPSIPRLLFERMYTTEELGYYSSIATITVLITTLVSCVLLPFMPKYALYFEKKDKKALIKITAESIGITVGLGVIAIACALLLGKWVLVLLFGEGILPYTYIFPGVILATILTAIIACLNNFFVATNEQRKLMIGAMIGATLCLVSAGLFCRYFYMMGIVYCLLFSQMIEIIVLIIFMWIILKKMKEKNGENCGNEKT